MQSLKHLAWILVIKMSSCCNDLCNMCFEIRFCFKMIDLNGHQIQTKYHHITSFVIVVLIFCTIKKLFWIYFFICLVCIYKVKMFASWESALQKFVLITGLLQMLALDVSLVWFYLHTFSGVPIISSQTC